jgi:hypothetical protein
MAPDFERPTSSVGVMHVTALATWRWRVFASATLVSGIVAAVTELLVVVESPVRARRIVRARQAMRLKSDRGRDSILAVNPGVQNDWRRCGWDRPHLRDGQVNRRQETNMQIKMASITVDDREKDFDIYTTKRGFTKKADIAMGPIRWLTVSSPGAQMASNSCLKKTTFRHRKLTSRPDSTLAFRVSRLAASAWSGPFCCELSSASSGGPCRLR